MSRTDLDAYISGMHNCLTIPIDKPLAIGFHTRQTDVRPAGSINTAMQLCAVIMQCQSLEQFGGVAYSHIDWSMVPYIRKSFAKHFVDGLVHIAGLTEDEAKEYINSVFEKYTETEELTNDDRINYLDEMLKSTTSIDADIYTKC